MPYLIAFWKCGLVVIGDTSGDRLAKRKKTLGEAVCLTLRLLVLRPDAWSGERSSDTSLAPFWTSMSCVGASRLRMTTVWNVGLFAPQYFGLAFRSTSDVVLKLCSTYGPLPADVEFRNDSALSDLSAPGWSVPPCALTTAEFTMPSAGFGTMNGMAGFGSFDVSTTVDGSGAVTVTPSSRKDGLPWMLISRLNEKRTSADVSGVPSENLTSFRSVNVYVLASADAV